MKCKHEPGPYFLRGWLIESWTGSVAVIAKGFRKNNHERAQATAELLAAAPRLLDAACIGWDALSSILETVDEERFVQTPSGIEVRKQALEAIDKLFAINEELKGLIMREEPTT